VATGIKAGSRYYISPIDYIQLEEHGDQHPIVFYEFGNLGTINPVTHIYTQGERLDQIAYKYYSRPSLWWIIALYNPSILDISNIKPGTALVIPNV
jgi:nucleoid-associated protein YgaU